MNLSNEIKSLLELKGEKKKDLLNVLDLSRPQALTTKFARNSWSAEDLAKVVKFLGGKLLIRVDGREVEITEKHFESRKSEN